VFRLTKIPDQGRSYNVGCTMSGQIAYTTALATKPIAAIPTTRAGCCRNENRVPRYQPTAAVPISSAAWRAVTPGSTDHAADNHTIAQNASNIF
jgi:hypothetical protein